MRTRMAKTIVAALLGLGLFLAGCDKGTQTQEGKTGDSVAWNVKAKQAIDKGNAWLLKTQDANGSWSAPSGPAITAMAVKALVQGGKDVKDPAVQKGLDYILKQQVTDAESSLRGAFVGPDGQQHANYNTAICLSTLVLVNGKLEGKPYDKQITDGLAFVRRDQWDDSESVDKDNPAYGGWGYGSGQRPDMSNTNMTMDALKAMEEAGYIEKDDPMYQKAQVFTSRSQNRSESNDTASWAITEDGGFIYTPATSPVPGKGGAESKAGSVTLPDGRSGLVSYGNMTYAGFKSFVYSGLTREDPRVKAAWNWIRKNYTLDANPGMPAPQAYQGLYYYFHTFSRALNAANVQKITDDAGVEHHWRADLTEKVAALQDEDGKWINEKAERWEEGNPVLATCFAVLALEEAVAGR